ncbi:MAG TPA: LLM class F420-dependent oxidoreductase [Pseudonocardiaceae bacterium]|jgi:probable F420-dependent oxidoreductase|nr:LLM class F420-dependent oxidoreductase [Pseudonocardiaceae bacterium]
MATELTRPLRIGLQVKPQHADYSVIRRAAVTAEELGVDILFNWDHFFPLGKIREGKHFECWTMLGAWAEATSRIMIGPLVTCNGYRNPDLLADMARTVDHISGGRLVLGMGAGFREWEFQKYGYEPGTPGSRLTELAEALPRIKTRFAALNPPPVSTIPMLIGGSGERRTLKLVAEHADIWHTFTEGDELAHKQRVLARHCADLGRDPAEIEHSVFIGGDPKQVGPPLRDLGVTLFVPLIGGPDLDFTEVRSWLAWRDEQNRAVG